MLPALIYFVLVILLVQIGLFHPTQDPWWGKIIFWVIWLGGYFLSIIIHLPEEQENNSHSILKIKQLEDKIKENSDAKGFFTVAGIILPGFWHVAGGVIAAMSAYESEKLKGESEKLKGELIKAQEAQKRSNNFVIALTLFVFTFSILICQKVIPL
jgi:hypothetical protein